MIFAPGELSTPLDEGEMDALDAMLQALESDDSIYCLSELDGFFTALVSGPEAIMPSEWLDHIWGGPGNAPEWESKEEFQHFFGLLMRHMNSIATALMEAPETFTPCFMAYDAEGKTHMIVDEWCIGYMRGAHLRPDAWQLDDDYVRDLFGPIPLFSSDAGREVLDILDDDDLREFQEGILPAALDLHAYWLAQRTPGGGVDPYIRVEPRVGRNDPCPCGSGKKFKKCCGLN